MCEKQSSSVVSHILLRPSIDSVTTKRLMSSHTIEDLTSCILDFQANMIRVTFRKKNTVIEPDAEPLHAIALNTIWIAGKLEPSGSAKWRKLGFKSESMAQEFSEVGALGLDCLVRGETSTLLSSLSDCHCNCTLQRHFAYSDQASFAQVQVIKIVAGNIVLIYSLSQVVQEQISRPEERRCPIGRTSNEIVELLCEHWNIFAPGCEF